MELNLYICCNNFIINIGMRHKLRLYIGLVVLTLCIASCTKEYFDEDAYNNIVKEAFPVTNVDPNHDWQTIETSDLSVNVNQTPGATYTIRAYEQDPETNAAVTVMAEGRAEDGKTFLTSLIHPTVDSVFYVARIDSAGYREVKAARAVNGTVSANFTTSDTDKHKESNDISYFSWRYVFEDAFPQPGDYDFNDMVMTVTRQTDSRDPTKLYLTVSLDALGSMMPMAAAIHISGLNPALVESITSFQKFLFYKYSGVDKVNGDVDYTTAFNGDVVIPLFNDAHYALSRGDLVHGSPSYYYYNTVKDASSPYYAYSKIANPARVIYTIKCKSAEAVNNITSNTIDAFIITQYNGSYWETHAAPYKKYEVLYRYLNSNYQTAYTDNFPWALKVPGNFKYPTEGTPISKNRNGVSTGAYSASGHSFGEWAANENTAQDWYSHPNSTYVYE